MLLANATAEPHSSFVWGPASAAAVTTKNTPPKAAAGSLRRSAEAGDGRGQPPEKRKKKGASGVAQGAQRAMRRDGATDHWTLNDP